MVISKNPQKVNEHEHLKDVRGRNLEIMEKFVAKAELNVYGICTIPEATGEVTGHLITFYATYQEAYNVYKARYGNRATVSSESPAYKNTDFIHRFIIPKGVSYTRDDFEIVANELQFAETIFNIETYGKNNNP